MNFQKFRRKIFKIRNKQKKNKKKKQKLMKKRFMDLEYQLV